MLESLKEKGLLYLLFVIFIINFLCMPKEQYKGDPMAIMETTKNFISNFDISVSQEEAATWEKSGKYFFYNKEKKKFFAKWGIGGTLIYLPPLLLKDIFTDKIDVDNGKTLTLILNLYNLMFSLLTAIYLYLILTFFSSNQFSKFFYILTAFYSTFLWNYLRAQNTEIFQMVCFLAFFYHFLKFIRLKNITAAESEKENSAASKQLLISIFFIFFISLLKIIYVLLIPIAILGVLLNCLLNNNPYSVTTFFKNFSIRKGYYFKFLILPLTLISICILAIQNYKFGSPFETGYGQYVDKGETNFGGNLFSGLSGYLFDPQWSIFINYPILFFSIFGITKFYKKYRFEAVFGFSIFLIFLLVNSKLPFWKGEWCYGPRYLLFLLPVITLPFLTLLDSLFLYLKKTAIAILLVISTTLFFSTMLQIYVNSLPFFIFYEVSLLYEPVRGGKVDKYFKNTHFGLINRDLVAFIKRETQFVGKEEVARRYDKNTQKEYDLYLRMLIKSNYYWFPDTVFL